MDKRGASWHLSPAAPPPLHRPAVIQESPHRNHGTDQPNLDPSSLPSGARAPARPELFPPTSDPVPLSLPDDLNQLSVYPSSFDLNWWLPDGDTLDLTYTYEPPGRLTAALPQPSLPPPSPSMSLPGSQSQRSGPSGDAGRATGERMPFTNPSGPVRSSRSPQSREEISTSPGQFLSGGVFRQPGLPGPGKTTTPKSTLPPEKVFSIQIGTELFRLSGASLASDAPSYFSQFFEEQLQNNESAANVRTLYIDRDPVTFQEISRHLQGYHVRPKDGYQFVKLFADAQFYTLPRLMSQLFESEIYIQIGDRDFQIPRDIFSSPGNSPNFFSLGFAVFFASPKEIFPGLDRKGLLRPPSIVPPSVPNRSAAVFEQLLHMLRGYPLHIKNEEHRSELLRDCRYFHLRGLEQQLIAHDISYNFERQKSEIVIRLEDIRQSGLQFVGDGSGRAGNGGWVHYARPFVDETSYELIVEIGGANTLVDLDRMRADFHGLAKARVTSLLQVVANKMNLPTNAPLGLMMMSGETGSQTASPGHTPLSEDRVKIRIGRDADVVVDGEVYAANWFEADITSTPLSHAGDIQNGGMNVTTPSNLSDTHVSISPAQPPRKRKREDSTDVIGGGNTWVVNKGLWRLRVHENTTGGMEVVFAAVKLDVFTGSRARNQRRVFL